VSVKFISELVFLAASFNLEASFGDADKSPDDYARQMASRAKHGRSMGGLIVKETKLASVQSLILQPPWQGMEGSRIP
jgi:hypothetical protein